MSEAKLISKEACEAAGDRWIQARARMDAANAEAKAAEAALYEAEGDLAAQEAAPGIPAHWHASVAKEACRIGYKCKVHNPEEVPW